MSLPRAASESTIPPLWPALLWSAAAAMVLDLSPLHAHHHGDSLVLVLTSLVKWTPMYWEQNRLGTLVPLLALPVRDPLGNLLLQGWLNLFASLASMALLCRYLLRSAAWPVAAALYTALFLLLTSDGYQFEYLLSQPIGVSTALGLGGLLLAERAQARRSRPLAVLGGVSCALAHWVNLGSFVTLLPLALLVPWAMSVRSGASSPAAWRRSAAPVGTVLFGALMGWVAARTLGTWGSTAMGQAPVATWSFAWSQLLQNTRSAMGGHLPLALAGAAVAALLFLGARTWARRAHAGDAATGLLGAASGLGAALVGFLYVGTLAWTQVNEYAERYASAPVFLALASLACVAALPSVGALGPAGARRRGLLLAGCGALAVTTAAARYGPPSVSTARQALERDTPLTRDLLDAGATHVLGTYWKVWPAVYRTLLVSHEEGRPHVVYGLTHRSWATHALWSAVPPEQLRLAILRDDPEEALWRETYGFQELELLEERATVRLYRLPPERARRE